MRKNFWLVVFLSFAGMLCYADTPEQIVFNKDNGFMSWVEEREIKIRPDRIFQEPTKVDVQTNISDQMIKIRFEDYPTTMRAWYSDDGPKYDDFDITLSGFGTFVSCELDRLSGNLQVLLFLKLDNKFLKHEHFEILYNAMRQKKPVVIEGYIDGTKDIKTSIKKDRPLEIDFIFHPTSLNGKSIP